MCNFISKDEAVWQSSGQSHSLQKGLLAQTTCCNRRALEATRIETNADRRSWLYTGCCAGIGTRGR
eukprot:3655829-Amphidinium_carterae.1